jgi:2-polyprenyl-3-methyl-5-hydroxy-6-metoxy-1,4-benzoquinol methylase
LSSTQQLEQSHIALQRGPAIGACADAGPACPLCSCSNNRVAFRDNRCSLRVCNVCELFFVDPYPSPGYQHAQVASRNCDEIELLDCEHRYEGERLYYYRHFASIAEECRGAKSLLDVGCGTGHLLERFAVEHGLYRAGIELNPEAARFAERVSGCEVIRVPLEDFHCDRRFDVITMINVFSHIPSFEAMFRSLRGLLASHGKLILRTTEMAANVSRWNQAHWGIPDDLQFMGLRTLEFVCAKYGFAIRRRVRTPFENELFRISRWQQMGRNPLQNAVKRAMVRFPYALQALRSIYAACLGQRLFVSLIVLTAQPQGENK